MSQQWKVKKLKGALSDPELATLFNEYHERGSKEFGWAWFRMNQLMVYAANTVGVPHDEQPFKLLLTICAMKALANVDLPVANGDSEGRS